MKIESIQDKIARFYSQIENYEEGAPNTRYKSWEWCHKAFLEHRKDRSDKNIEFLSLHLAFYLASWGMYRGSSYLLQRDYKAHKEAVRAILQQQYESLWNFEPTEQNINEADNRLFDPSTGVYWRVKESYCDYEGDQDDEASDTLTTKILMGTFGCIPAFDRFLKRGIGHYCKANGSSIHDLRLTQSIEKQGKKEPTDSFKALAFLALDKKEEFQVSSGFMYPPMKCVDMYLWEIGYELDLADSLGEINEKTKQSKKDKLIQRAQLLLGQKAGSTKAPDKLSKQIRALNPDRK